MGRPLPFRWRLYTLFIGSLTIPIVLVALVTAWYFTTRADQDGATSRSNTLTTLADTIQTNLDELDRIAFTPYLYKESMSTLLAMQNGYFLNPPPHMDLIGMENSYETTMKKLMFTAKQQVDSVTFYPMNRGENHAYRLSRNTAGVQIETVLNYESEAWFQHAIAGGRVYSMAPEQPGQDAQQYFYDAVITDMDTKRDMGVLRIEASSRRLLESFHEISVREGSLVLLAISDGTVLSLHGDRSLAIGDTIDRKALGADFLFSEQRVEDTQWKLYYLTAKSVSDRSTAIAFGIALAVAACATLAALAIFRHESSTTITNVEDILATLNRIQKGEFSATSGVSSKDELGVIAAGVNQMGSRIEDHINREYAAVIKRQEAEYRALQAQIDPHFFYNTLNDIIGLNRMGETAIVEKSLRQVTRLFRYSCSTADTTTVQDEIGFCEQYLWLRKLQFEDRLHFEVFIAPAAEESVIPKFILQPIIENCINHGMGNRRTCLSIAISATVEDDYVKLTIADDGVGFNANEEQTSHGFGLENVRQRLQLGVPGSSFTLHTAQQEGVQVVIMIPQTQPDSLVEVSA